MSAHGHPWVAAWDDVAARRIRIWRNTHKSAQFAKAYAPANKRQRAHFPNAIKCKICMQASRTRRTRHAK